ncbi:hypothetical protein GCM10022280_02210 [Sphingomonas swuensis]|uniref:FAS1 domain-containing protein n=1 Tax=Sphingomonas swuensis TaxID=977800 RepID=A0ABP7SAV9_9SPHN
MRARLIVLGTTALLLAACGQGGEGNNAVANGGAEGSNAAAPAAGNLAAVLGTDPRFTALVAAAGMTPVFEGKTPYTVLAPTSQALDALPAGTLERLQQPAGKAELTGLLRRHVLPGTILAADLTRAVESGGGKATLASMAGDPLTVTRSGNGLKIADSSGKGAMIVGGERIASNGVVHTIDAVLPAPAQAAP